MRAMVLRTTSPPLAPASLTLEELPTPRAEGPFEVVVRVAAAGVCRTDLHLLTGQMVPPLPLVLGHENAGWIHEIGSEVTSVAVGDAVICYPFVGNGLSAPERSGLDTRAPDRLTPGITVDGGYAEYLLTNERSMVAVPPHALLRPSRTPRRPPPRPHYLQFSIPSSPESDPPRGTPRRTPHPDRRRLSPKIRHAKTPQATTHARATTAM